MRELADAGMSRADHVVALGGGVVGDLAGFCAATYQRGVPVVHVPTTLVAQVDSAYGGKTGVDLREAKNYVGAYHLPAAVLADPRTLATLPRGELAAGFAEVVKTALIAGGALWERVRAIDELDPDDARRGDLRLRADQARRRRRRRARCRPAPGAQPRPHRRPRDRGRDRLRRYRHGEAVGLGLLAALTLSGATALRAEVARSLARQGLPTELDPAVDADAVARGDRRATRSGPPTGVGFVLCERPGEPRSGGGFDPDRVRAAVKELQPAMSPTAHNRIEVLHGVNLTCSAAGPRALRRR